MYRVRKSLESWQPVGATWSGEPTVSRGVLEGRGKQGAAGYAGPHPPTVRVTRSAAIDEVGVIGVSNECNSEGLCWRRGRYREDEYFEKSGWIGSIAKNTLLDTNSTVETGNCFLRLRTEPLSQQKYILENLLGSQIPGSRF